MLATNENVKRAAGFIEDYNLNPLSFPLVILRLQKKTIRHYSNRYSDPLNSKEYLPLSQITDLIDSFPSLQILLLNDLAFKDKLSESLFLAHHFKLWVHLDSATKHTLHEHYKMLTNKIKIEKPINEENKGTQENEGNEGNERNEEDLDKEVNCGKEECENVEEEKKSMEIDMEIESEGGDELFYQEDAFQSIIQSALQFPNETFGPVSHVQGAQQFFNMPCQQKDVVFVQNSEDLVKARVLLNAKIVSVKIHSFFYYFFCLGWA